MRRWVAGVLLALCLGLGLGAGGVALLLRGSTGPVDADAAHDPGAAETELDPAAGASDDGPADPPAPALDPPEEQDASDAERLETVVPRAPQALVDHLEATLAADDVQAVEQLSVLVVDEAGRAVAGLDPDRPVTPASTTKLVTAAAALRLLGAEYRYVTRALAAAEPDGGELDGDLVLLGSGDPALASPVFIDEVYPARPHTELERLAEQVAATGITRVRGTVRGDPRLFADEPVAEGWADRYFTSLDATNASGLTIDGGRRIFERNDVLLGEAAEEPAVHAAEVLTALLSEHGIEVAHDPGLGTVGADAVEVARIRSAPLRELLAYLVQQSDNHMADGVFRTVGAVAGTGTWRDSEAVVRETLTDVDVDWSAAVLEDGSGLSREGRLSARMLAELDRVMTHEHPEVWPDLLAVAGASGTLRNRLRGTVADGRLAGKTGALRDARSLAGQVTALDGRRYHFAVVGGELDGPGIQAVRGLMDEIVLLLAGGPPPCAPDELGEDRLCPDGTSDENAAATPAEGG